MNKIKFKNVRITTIRKKIEKDNKLEIQMQTFVKKF